MGKELTMRVLRPDERSRHLRVRRTGAAVVVGPAVGTRDVGGGGRLWAGTHRRGSEVAVVAGIRGVRGRRGLGVCGGVRGLVVVRDCSGHAWSGHGHAWGGAVVPEDSEQSVLRTGTTEGTYAS